MGIKEKMMESMMNETTKSLGKVLESIHAHLEIMSRELIRTRLEMKQSEVSNDDVEKIIEEYQKLLN